MISTQFGGDIFVNSIFQKGSIFIFEFKCETEGLASPADSLNSNININSQDDIDVSFENNSL